MTVHSFEAGLRWTDMSVDSSARQPVMAGQGALTRKLTRATLARALAAQGDDSGITLTGGIKSPDISDAVFSLGH
jgi:hypothetical protein